jgi:hypothetical protein
VIRTSSDSNVIVIGAGPYGLSSGAYLRAEGMETRVFGEPMAFWKNQMPAGMYLRSSWEASHIADPEHALTLNNYFGQNAYRISRPIPLDHFVDYGRWYQENAVPHLDTRRISSVEIAARGFKVIVADGEAFTSRRVVVAGGIGPFATRPVEFDGVPCELASHTSEQNDLRKFRGKRVVVVGAGQSALESAALLKEIGVDAEVIARTKTLNWVGLHPRLHQLGLISDVLYSTRDVGPAGISRLVSQPHIFRRFPRRFQDCAAYRAIRPAGAGWLQPRIAEIAITLGRRVVRTADAGSQLHLWLDDGTERQVDHVLLATGFRVDVSRYPFLSQSLLRQLKTVDGFPVLNRGLESSIPGLHFLGKPASWSFGPLLGFVSGAEFASLELTRLITMNNGKHRGK